MNNFFDALFFKLYALAKRTGNKEESVAMITAVCMIAMIFSSLTITIIEYFACFILHSTFLLGSIPALLAIIITVGVIFYSRYMYRRHYNVLYERYKTENLYRNRKGTWITISFIIATFLFFLSLIWIKC